VIEPSEDDRRAIVAALDDVSDGARIVEAQLAELAASVRSIFDAEFLHQPDDALGA
jgi:hypothetical protein